MNKAEVEKQAKTINPEDAEKVVKRRKTIKQKASRGPLKKMMSDIMLMVALIIDYWWGLYVRTPWWTISAILVALLWILNPLDLVPDAIPLFGLLDDAAVVAIVMAMTEQDLADYKAWKQARRTERRRRKR
jgi:uncharacterized membrane protein YkvA (DUF1232 family)